MMPRPNETTKDSRSVMIVNGASVLLAVVTVCVWVSSSPNLPDLIKLGLGVIVSLVTLAFLALAIHRSTMTTNTLHFPTPS